MAVLSKDSLRFSPIAAKYFKKLKDKKLLNLYKKLSIKYSIIHLKEEKKREI